MLFDTDVLIWALRGRLDAAQCIEAAEERRVSVVTYMDLLQGARDAAEQRMIQRFLADAGFATMPLSEAIGHRAVVYMEEYGLKGGMALGDALVAATAAEAHLPLCTANRKHYRLISDITLRVFRP